MVYEFSASAFTPFSHLILNSSVNYCLLNLPVCNLRLANLLILSVSPLDLRQFKFDKPNMLDAK
jgi:hypothetical protein